MSFSSKSLTIIITIRVLFCVILDLCLLPISLSPSGVQTAFSSFPMEMKTL